MVVVTYWVLSLLLGNANDIVRRPCQASFCLPTILLSVTDICAPTPSGFEFASSESETTSLETHPITDLLDSDSEIASRVGELRFAEPPVWLENVLASISSNEAMIQRAAALSQRVELEIANRRAKEYMDYICSAPFGYIRGHLVVAEGIGYQDGGKILTCVFENFQKPFVMYFVNRRKYLCGSFLIELRRTSPNLSVVINVNVDLPETEDLKKAIVDILQRLLLPQIMSPSFHVVLRVTVR